MTQELAKEKGYTLDKDGYDKAFADHQALSKAGAEQKFKGGLADGGELTTRLHSATHLLNAALKLVLHDDSIQQKGSNITSERLRFDFNFPRSTDAGRNCRGRKGCQRRNRKRQRNQTRRDVRGRGEKRRRNRRVRQPLRRRRKGVHNRHFKRNLRRPSCKTHGRTGQIPYRQRTIFFRRRKTYQSGFGVIKNEVRHPRP